MGGSGNKSHQPVFDAFWPTARYTSLTAYTANAKATLIAPSACVIAEGNTRCNVKIQISNPGGRSVQLWAQAPGEPQEKAIIGVITSTAFSFDYPWVTTGTTTLHLYDVSGGTKQILDTKLVSGMASR